MKTTLFLLALFSSLLLPSCYNLALDLQGTQVQKWVTPENVALAVSAAYLNKHPEADATLLLLADELRATADAGMVDLSTAYEKIEKAMKEHEAKHTKEVLFLLDGLFDQYAYIFDSNQVDVVEYKDTLYQIADGIEAALTIVYTQEMREQEKYM